VSDLAPNRGARVGRMLAGLLAAEPGKGRITLSVRVEGRRRMHETFELRTWAGRDLSGRGWLFVGIPRTADWDASPPVKPVTPVSVNLESGEVVENFKDERSTRLLRWLARRVLDYAMTGELRQPGNGRLEIREASRCGACGRPLTDDVSIELGLGRDCERKLYGDATPRSRTARSAG
jgi:hypothetical protein